MGIKKISLYTLIESLLTISYYKVYVRKLKLSTQSGVYARTARKLADAAMKTGICDHGNIELFLFISDTSYLSFQLVRIHPHNTSIYKHYTI